MSLKRPELTEPIIAAAIEVHRGLGPGQPEKAYQRAIRMVLLERGIFCENEMAVPIKYSGLELDCGYRLDLLVGGSVAVELKCVEALLPVHTAQMLTYLRLGGWQIGLLLNFRVALLRQGIRRFVFEPVLDRSSIDFHPIIPGHAAMREPFATELLAACQLVHSRLEPGLLASAYEACLLHELSQRGIPAHSHVEVPLCFQNRPLAVNGVLALLVGGRLPVDLHSVERITPLQIDEFQSLLRHGNWPIGISLNSNVADFADGIHWCVPAPHLRTSAAPC